MVAYTDMTLRAASRAHAPSAAVMAATTTAVPATRWQLDVPSTIALRTRGLSATGIFAGSSHVTPPATVSIPALPVVNDDRTAKRTRSPRGGQR